MKPSEILALAEVYLDEYGWCQGRLDNDQGQMCVVGALMYATNNYPKTQEYYVARSILERAVGTDYLGDWNDAPGRTVEEVKAALRKARDLAAKEGR